MPRVDTSVRVAALLNENSTALAQRWLGGQPAGELAISGWVITESSAALSMKLRTGESEQPQRNEVLASFHPADRGLVSRASRFAPGLPDRGTLR